MNPYTYPATVADLPVVTEDDVVREGNVTVVLPWDGRIGEIWDDGLHEHGPGNFEHMYGIAGISKDSGRVFWQQSWWQLEEMYGWYGAEIRRAPAGAEPGHFVQSYLDGTLSPATAA